MQLDETLIDYVMRYYAHLLPEREWWAHRHMSVLRQTQNANEAYREKALAKFGAQDPAAIELLADGNDAFRERCVTWLLMHKQDEVFLNRCLRCDGLARTPRARQCRFCGLDWH